MIYGSIGIGTSGVVCVYSEEFVDLTSLSQEMQGVEILEHLDLKQATIIAEAVPPINVINKPNCSIVNPSILFFFIIIYIF
tara:strand:- start:465 stop:707 length:243 start_codon:yes stop_codon:yes gene_type:complete